jgi:hypothetical protein
MIRDPQELQALAAKMEPARERYLKWKQVVDRYKKGSKTKLAQIYTIITIASSVDERKNMALSHPDYVQYLSEWDTAEKAMIKARVLFENLQSAYDALTSALAFDRESMKRLGG